MKFIKSNLAKKLIIILIAILLFNYTIPYQAFAASTTGGFSGGSTSNDSFMDKLGESFGGTSGGGIIDSILDALGFSADSIAGILFKPLASLVSAVVTTVNVSIGLFLQRSRRCPIC